MKDKTIENVRARILSSTIHGSKTETSALIRVEVQGSHGYRPTDRLIAERADLWAFAAENMGLR